MEVSRDVHDKVMMMEGCTYDTLGFGLALLEGMLVLKLGSHICEGGGFRQLKVV